MDLATKHFRFGADEVDRILIYRQFMRLFVCQIWCSWSYLELEDYVTANKVLERFSFSFSFSFILLKNLFGNIMCFCFFLAHEFSQHYLYLIIIIWSLFMLGDGFSTPRPIGWSLIAAPSSNRVNLGLIVGQDRCRGLCAFFQGNYGIEDKEEAGKRNCWCVPTMRINI